MKKTAGFTLVELIVVIAILAILAGIALPIYTNYIKKANEAADLQMLDAVKTAAVFEATDQSKTKEVEITKITVTSGDTEVELEGTGLIDKSGVAFTTVDIEDYVATTAFQSDHDGAEWSSSTSSWDWTD